MKKLLTILITLPFAIYGQNFSFESTDTTFYGEVNDIEFATSFDISNDSTKSFPMSWEIEDEMLMANWEFSICDPEKCYPIGAKSGSFNLPVSTFNRIMNIHYYPNGSEGKSDVVLKLWQDDLPDKYVLLKWTGIVSSTAEIDNHETPTVVNIIQTESEKVWLDYNLNTKFGEVKFTLYDVNGKIKKTIPIADNQGTLLIKNEMKQGLYFFTFTSDENIIFKDKLVVN